jgi:hypothetical protein
MLDKNSMKTQYIGTHIFHIFVVAPLLYCIGAKKGNSKESTIRLLIAILLLAFLYHGSILLKKTNYISMGHIIMAVIGIYYLIKDKRPEYFYICLVLLSLYVAGKHGYLLYNLVKN